MGSKLSRNKLVNGIPSRVSKKPCDCALYYTSKHCCKNRCFPLMPNVLSLIEVPGEPDQDQWTFTESHKECVQSAASLFGLDFQSDLVEIIRLFLSESLKGYVSHCHGAINHFMKNGGSLCTPWYTHRVQEYGIKCMVFGHGGAGKSSLIMRWVTGEYREWDPSIEDSYRKTVEVDGKEVLIDVIDTAGQQEFASMQDRWIRECQVAILCFAINEEKAL